MVPFRDGPAGSVWSRPPLAAAGPPPVPVRKRAAQPVRGVPPAQWPVQGSPTCMKVLGLMPLAYDRRWPSEPHDGRTNNFTQDSEAKQPVRLLQIPHVPLWPARPVARPYRRLWLAHTGRGRLGRRRRRRTTAAERRAPRWLRMIWRRPPSRAQRSGAVRYLRVWPHPPHVAYPSSSVCRDI